MAPTIESYIKGKRALIVEDEAAIAQLMKMNLVHMGFDVEVCADAESGIDSLKTKSFDLCLLDWMLPQMQGIDFLKSVRPVQKKIKIMMVTAKADADSIVSGLESGADDYLPKPFDIKVLQARVRHLMRRLNAEEQSEAELSTQKKSDANESVDVQELKFDGLEIHISKHRVKYQGEEVHLTPSEFKLLVSLFKAQGSVMTREQLIDLIQGEDVSVTGRTIDTHIFALRKKIGAWSKYIETVRGVGYRILISADDISESGGL